MNVPHAVGVGTRARSRSATTCTGANTTGPFSFNGVANVGNTAGGLYAVDGPFNPPETGYAGVVAGCNNVAGDFYTGVLAGIGNAIQNGVSSPDSNSPAAVIVGGGGNSIGSSASAVIGAGASNTIAGAIDSVIAAGGGNSIEGPSIFGNGGLSLSGIVAGSGNIIGGGVTSFIGAGTNNAITLPSPQTFPISSSSVITGGDNNKVTGADSFIAGGALNAIGNGTPSQVELYAAIGGGYSNTILANYATIAGGSSNKATGQTAVVAGGYRNSVTALNGAVLGGTANVASGFAAAVGGGSTNTASGRQAVVPGGELNVASGQNSFAGGTRSLATAAGSFVWSDDATGAKTVTATVPNVFLVRASGGVAFYSAANLSSGVSLAPGSGAWSTLSDRNVKTGIERVDQTRILAKLAAMPVSEWSYTAQGTGVRHLGPMAQDFRAAFGLGEDDRHISTVDEEGVALAAIKALQAENVSLKSDNASLHEAHRADEARLAQLEQRLDAVEMRLAK